MRKLPPRKYFSKLALVLFCIYSFIVLFSCTKKDAKNISFANQVKEQGLVKNYLTKQQELVSSSQRSWIGDLKNYLSFEKASFEKYTNNTYLVTIPVNCKFSENFYPQQGKALVSEMDQYLMVIQEQDDILAMNIVSVNELSKKTAAENMSHVLVNTLTDQSSNFTGSLRILTILKDFQLGINLENGKTKSTEKLMTKKLSRNKVANRSNNDNTNEYSTGPASDTPECVDYWYVINYYDSDGRLIYTDWISYAFTVCGGGGGGSGGVADITADEELTNFNSIVSGTTVASIPRTEITSNISSTLKYKNPDWTILKGFPGTWGLISHETGIIQLADASTNKWVWQSISHSGITMEGFTSPGTSVSYNQGMGTPSFVGPASITNNILYAGMRVDFEVTYSFLPTIPVINSTPPVHINYSTSAFWDARP